MLNVKVGKYATNKAIDPHVHFRGFEERQKCTISSGMALAASQGVVAIIDMPNSKPPIISWEIVNMRLTEANNEGCTKGYYLFIGATSNPNQIKEAAYVAKNNSRVAGIKMYAGKSTNPSISVIEYGAQRIVYQTLVQEDYRGVLALHCEKESLSNYALWVPERPSSWNRVKPPESEVESVRDQIRLAEETGFKGHLHICHTSVPESVYLVNEAKKRGKIRISCCLTPHHFLYSTDDMLTPDAVRLKVNPPIRSPEMMREMRALLRFEKIDIIETDFAPHEPENKTYKEGKPKETYASGIPSLAGYRDFLDSLVEAYNFTPDHVKALTYDNVKRIFTKIVE
ncbi:MAG: dihydroorotase [Candidatus Micrarchaeota archaeon]|nr:dihydroorotase [Candidatus Micrarchaeota archaeon]